MSAYAYDAAGVLREQWDDVTRTYTAWDENGAEISSRPYTDDENAAADAADAAERAAAAEATRAAQADALLTASLATQGGQHDGDEWVQPVGPADAYPAGARVTYEGSTWASLVDFNVWEPPTNWREEPDTGYPAWVQPTGASDAYPAGARVTHNAADWQSELDANVWEPGVYGWTQIP